MVLYTVKETADILKVTTTTVYRWIWKGSLSHKKVGELVRVSKDDLESFINGDTTSQEQ